MSTSEHCENTGGLLHEQHAIREFRPDFMLTASLRLAYGGRRYSSGIPTLSTDILVLRLLRSGTSTAVLADCFLYLSPYPYHYVLSFCRCLLSFVLEVQWTISSSVSVWVFTPLSSPHILQYSMLASGTSIFGLCTFDDSVAPSVDLQRGLTEQQIQCTIKQLFAVSMSTCNHRCWGMFDFLLFL